MKEKEVILYINKMFKDGKLVTKEDSDTEKIEVVRLDPEVAYTNISAEKKLVVNLGNYQSASFSVFMSVPCPLDTSGEQQEEAYKYCSSFCGNKIVALKKEVGR